MRLPPGGVRGRMPATLDQSVIAYASNNSVFGEAVVKREYLYFPPGYGYLSHTTEITTANPQDEDEGRWKYSSDVERGTDGLVSGVWVEARAGNRNSFGPTIWVGVRLIVTMGWGIHVSADPRPRPNGAGSSIAIASFAITPGEINAGETTTFKVTLTQPAAPGGTTVGFDSITTRGLTDTLVNRPVSLKIPEGATEGTSVVRTQRQTEGTTEIIFTAHIGDSKISNLLKVH
jgi:hypothetical protein